MQRVQNPVVFPWILGLVAVGGLGAAWFGRERDEEEEDVVRSTNPQPQPSTLTPTQPSGLVLEPPHPVQRHALPNQCDPLEQLPAPYRCVPAGAQYVAVDPRTSGQVAMPQATGVVFSADYAQYRAGAAWERGVLGRWLEEALRTGALGSLMASQELRGVPSTSAEWQWLALEEAGWSPLVRVRYEETLGSHDPWVKATGVGAIRAFAESHVVHTPMQPVRIIDLPQTKGATHLLSRIAQVTAAAQRGEV